MKRKQLLTLLCVLVAGVAAGALVLRLGFESAKAQSNSMRQKWEYCAITGVGTVSRDEITLSVTHSASICYFESGCRREAINVSVDASKFADGGRMFALAGAIDKLGEDGWEMIGESTFGLSNDSSVLYFRRPQR